MTRRQLKYIAWVGGMVAWMLVSILVSILTYGGIRRVTKI